MRKVVFVALLSLAATYATFARAAAVGNVGAVNQSAQGTPPGGASHTLSLGGDVVDKERIDTKADGKAQIIFLDKSTLAVGANSSVTINHFVYDAEAGAGKQSVSLAKGALRFIGGGVSHGAGAEINTPSATIGVRGGMLMVRAGEPDGDHIVLLGGVATIRTPTGQTVELTRPGYGVLVAPGGTSISEPALASSETIANFDMQFASLPGQTGGADGAGLPGAAQALARLGDFRLPDFTPWAGLGAIGAHWGGRAVAQSHAQSVNQATATRTQQTVAAVIAAAKDPNTSGAGGGSPSGGGVTSTSPTSAGMLGPFSRGFCVWGCVTPTYVSSSYNSDNMTSTVIFRADFSSSGHGYFLITLSVSPSSFTVSETLNGPSGSGSQAGVIAASVAYHPAGGGAVETNTYNISLNETFSYQGMTTTGPTPSFTSWSVSGSDTLNFINVGNVVLSPPATSSNSFFSIPNGFSETFNLHYP
jgi:hypothetical protein